MVCVRTLHCRAAGSQMEELGTARSELAASLEHMTAERDKLLPQLEQARWQNRQLEKKLEETAAARSTAEQASDRSICKAKTQYLMLVPLTLCLPASSHNQLNSYCIRHLQPARCKAMALSVSWF